ncbi:MAG TPA: class I tRNA ligase family protein, partial [Pyrinomonadaceae bacterium]|nr:class I tRNA ligase family protein [Pyrinomonadaceae bacterium]
HDRWIVSRLNRTAREVEGALSGYDFHAAVQSLYHFFWDDFCDWYIELSKQDVTAAEPSPERDAARSRALTVLEQALRLLHPFMPFVTEELWQMLPGVGRESHHAAYRESDVSPTVMLAAYPQAQESLIDERAEREMQSVIELVSRVRNIRTELNVRPGEQVRVVISAGANGAAEVFGASVPQIMRLTRASDVALFDEMPELPRASARQALSGGVEVAVPLEGLIDFAREAERIGREREKLGKELEKLEAQLANPQFTGRAPAEKVAELRQRADDVRQRISALREMQEALQG